MSALKLIQNKHPHRESQRRFDLLVGIDRQKNELLDNLFLFFSRNGLDEWLKANHKDGLPFLEQYFRLSPLFLLSGEVGCGKTELAQSIGSPLAERLGGKSLLSFETPSDIRGNGLVGELSKRITSSFEQARQGLQSGKSGILIIDEADDLATNRDQMQAHHEDRAGVNALIKEIDRIEKDNIPLAILIITNRSAAMDPAVLRRAATQLVFERPDAIAIRQLFQTILCGVPRSESDIDRIVQACQSKSTPFSYSDIIRRIGKKALILSWQENRPFSPDHLLRVIAETEPSPTIL